MTLREAPLVFSPPLARLKAVLPMAGEPLVDTLGRPLRDLRISVTDRCNFRCSYCMPKQVFDKHHEFLPHAQLLSFEEIERLARVFVGLGVEKLRITGGEPTLRRGLENLIEMLARLRTPDGRELDLTLTTNGSTLVKKAATLKGAGLKRLTVSLDGLDDAVFQRMNDVGFPVAEVLDGIRAAQAVGLGPIKVNMVVQRGVNDDQILAMARHFRHSGVVLRFIEYMDVGATNGWRMDQVLPSAEVQRRIAAEWPLDPAVAQHAVGENAERWAYADGGGEVGFISSGDAGLLRRLQPRSAVDRRPALHLPVRSTVGTTLRGLLRGVERGQTMRQLANAIAGVWGGRDDRYSQLRGTAAGNRGAARRDALHRWLSFTPSSSPAAGAVAWAAWTRACSCCRGGLSSSHVVEPASRRRPDTLLISANRNLDAYAALGHPCAGRPARPGSSPGRWPACWSHSNAIPDGDWLLTAPCDCPRLPAGPGGSDC